jgi:predicted O-methyltransferase YrrM
MIRNYHGFMLRRAALATSLIVRYGLRAVLLARDARSRGALQKKGELRPFIAFLRRQPVLRTVVEIGTYRGGTLWLWCQIADPNALIVTIDLPGGPFGGGYDDAQAEEIQSFARAHQQLVLLQGDSHAPATRDALAATLNGAPVDFLFIDGDHTYEGVKQDYEMYSPLVRMGGIIAFHDILPHTADEDCKVDLFWEELKQRSTGAIREFVDHDGSHDQPVWGGIGAVVAG